MSYGILTFDDFVGLIPALFILGSLLRGIVKLVIFLVPSFLKSKERQPQDANASLWSSKQSTPIDYKSVIFLLFVSYLLSPLNTMYHLEGKRVNPDIVDRPTDGPGLFDLIYGTDSRMETLIGKMPSLLRGPRAPLIFSNRHLQFFPWLLQNEIHRRQSLPFQRIEFAVSACYDKSLGDDCIRSPMMDDTITLDVFPPFDDPDNQYPGFDAGSPIIFFSPGLRCNSQDLPGTMIVRRAFGEGFRSVVVNRRGHTPDRKLQAPRWNLFGDRDDLEQVYWHVQEKLAAPNTPFFLHGISSGCSNVVSALADWDRRLFLHQQQQQQQQQNKTSSGEDGAALAGKVKVAPSFVASISVTPGYDISKVFRPERFKYPYNPLLVNSVKDHFVLQNEKVLRSFDSIAVDAALQASNLQDFLNAAAPFAGYPNSTEYYKGENPVNGVHFITTPKMILNSIDDPCCNVHNIYEQSPYPQHNDKTYAKMVSESPHGLLAVTKTGTHCPFLDSNTYLFPAFTRDPYSGEWMLDSWADRVSVEFYKAALEVFNDRRFMQ